MILRNLRDHFSNENVNEKLLIAREETESIELGYVSVDSGKSTHVGLHDDEEEIYVILGGKGILKIGDEEREVTEGDIAYVPRGKTHRMSCTSEEALRYLYFANWPK